MDGQSRKESHQMMQIVQNVVRMVLMNMPGIGTDQKLDYSTFLNISEVEGDLVLLIAKVDQQVEKGGFVLDGLEVVENATDYQLFEFRIILAVRKIHNCYSVKFGHPLVLRKLQPQKG